MVIIYNIALCFLYGGMFIASIFNAKAQKWIVGRNGLFKRLKKQIDKNDKVMWMHCSSLGEFEQGLPVLEEFRVKNPQYKILLTFFSPSGYEMRKDYDKADFVSYMPLDTWFNARRFINIVHPNVVFFVKYDFWYHHLHKAKKQGAKQYLISAVFRSGQIFFKWYGGFFRSMLRTFTRIFVQNKESEQLLQSIDIADIMITGDTRIDRVKQIAKQLNNYPTVERFINSKPCLICGSTWEKDEELLSKATSELNQVKLVVAPHLIHDSHIEDIEKLFSNRRTIRYTKITNEAVEDYDILIIDTVGMLKSIYRYGQVAYIGGGFIDGIHNTLEALVFGLPVVFGTNYSKFIEARELVKLGGAISINNEAELQKVLSDWFGCGDLRRKAGDICRDYIWSKQSATDSIITHIEV